MLPVHFKLFAYFAAGGFAGGGQLAERGVCSSPAVCRPPASRHLRALLQAAALVEAQLAEHMAAHRAADVRTFHTWLTVRTPESSQVQI